MTELKNGANNDSCTIESGDAYRRSKNKSLIDLYQETSGIEVGKQEGFKSFGELSKQQLHSFTRIKLDEIFYAPENWNIYHPLIGEKRIHVKESIRRSGVLHNIIVWEAPDNYREDGKKYMVLGGRNRCDLSWEVFQEENDVEYFYIPARIYRLDEIDEIKARELVDESNLYRELTEEEKIYSIVQQYKILEEQYPYDGKMKLYDRLAEDNNESVATIRRNMALAKLIPELFCLFGIINIKVLCKISTFPRELQYHIYNIAIDEETAHLMKSSKLNRLSKHIDKEHIVDVLSESKEKVEVDENEMISIDIPKALMGKIKILISEWKKSQSIQ